MTKYSRLFAVIDIRIKLTTLTFLALGRAQTSLALPSLNRKVFINFNLLGLSRWPVKVGGSFSIRYSVRAKLGFAVILHQITKSSNCKIVNSSNLIVSRTKPTMSWFDLRNVCEVFEWKDPKTGVTVRGHNPPGGKDGKGVQRVPFHIKYITSKGVVEQGIVVCLKVYPELRQRMIQYVESRQIRRVRDYLVMEVNGTRVVTH